MTRTYSENGPSQEDVWQSTEGKEKNGKTKNEVVGRCWKGYSRDEGGKMAAAE